MGNPGMSFLLQQLPYQLPILMVCLGGFALAAILLNKHFHAAGLTMVGTGLLIFAIVAVMLAQWILVQPGNIQNGRQLMQGVALVGSLLRALGTAIIVAAVFVGRSQPTPFASPPAYPPHPRAQVR